MGRTFTLGNYNTITYRAIGLAPFQVVYGKPSLSLPIYILGTSNIEAIDTSLFTRGEVLAILQQNLQKSQQNMKKQADHHKTNYEFQIGDWVYFKLQPFRQRQN